MFTFSWQKNFLYEGQSVVLTSTYMVLYTIQKQLLIGFQLKNLQKMETHPCVCF